MVVLQVTVFCCFGNCQINPVTDLVNFTVETSISLSFGYQAMLINAYLYSNTMLL